MKVLVIAPHMDDEVLGCGGTIARHVAQGDEVFVCFIAHRIYGHKFDEKKNAVEEGHAKQAIKILGCKEAAFLSLPDERLDSCVQAIIIPLEEYFNRVKPQVVYCPFRGDNNQDHRAVFDAVRVVLRPAAAGFVERVYVYEAPSSTEQSPPFPENAFQPNHYVDVTSTIDQKVKAFGCYETEKRAYPHPRSPEAIKVLAQKRGTEVGFHFAEGFMTLRSKWQ